MSGSYPGLGFDPTPGEPGAVQAVLDTFVTAGEQLGQILPQLQSAVEIAGGWDGDAAEGFTDYGDDIPNGLAEGAQSLGRAAGALVAWFGQLVDNKAQAEALDAMARKLRRQIEVVWDAERDAQHALSTAVSPRSVASAQEAVNTAARAIGALQAELDIVLDEARELQQTHLDQANAAAEAIRGAKGDAFQPVNWISQAAGVVGSVLSEVSTWTGRAAFVAALVPGGQLVAAGMATASAGSGLLGTSGKVYAKVQGAPGLQNTSMASLLLDGALSVGGPVGKGVGQAFKGLAAAREEAARLGVKGVVGRTARNAFDEGQLGKVLKAYQDARGANSVRDALDRIGAAQVDDLARQTDIEKALKGAGMGTAGATDVADYADRANGGDGLTPWQKLPGKALDLPGAVTDAVNNAVREPFKPRIPEDHSGGSW